MPAKILIADDEDNILKLVKLCLEPEFNVITIGDGEGALEMVEKENPDLLLLDLMLPNMNGYEVCQRLKKANKHLPIIILSAKGQKEDILKGMDCGADQYVTKPFEPDELVQSVKMNLKKIGVK